MKKKILTLVAAAAMTLAMSMTAFAAGWVQNDTGWWWDNGDGTWPANEWRWLDGNGDGIAECYYFNELGWLEMDTTTPDNYIVNEDGQWVVNGVIQKKQLALEKKDVNLAGSVPGLTVELEDETYNEYGINKVAFEMLLQTREENKKYGEVAETVRYNYEHVVTYANGFEVVYRNPEIATWAKEYEGKAFSVAVSSSRTDLDNTWLLKFFYPNHQPNKDRVADTLEKDAFVRGMGFDVTSSTQSIFDHVEWKIGLGRSEVEVLWYCDDRVILYHWIREQATEKEENLFENSGPGSSTATTL